MPGLSLPDAVGLALGVLPSRLLDAPIGIAVSGGGDSVALLLLARQWAAGQGRQLCAFTVDHGLRAEARQEAETVARLCDTLGVAHQTLVLEGAPPRQSALRRLRHAALAGALRERGGHLLLTGHTADDQAETFLMRARQGSGWYGLAGMQPLSQSPVWPEGEGVFIARPLLGARREALRGLLRAEGIGWAEDPSNENAAFERVRMRRLLWPEMTRFDTILTLVDRFQALRMIEDGAIGRWMIAHVAAGEGGVVTRELSSLPAERAARALGILLQITAGRETPPRSENLARLAERLVSDKNFKGATLGGCRVIRRKESLIICPEGGQTDPRAHQRLASTIAVLTANAADFAASAGKESFLEELVPIF